MTVHELSYFRPDYVVTVGDNEERCEDAHRVVRNAIAIAGVLHDLPGQQAIDAMTAIEHAEHPRENVAPSPLRKAASTGLSSAVRARVKVRTSHGLPPA